MSNEITSAAIDGKPMLPAGVSAAGLQKIIELLDNVTLDINSAECVYIEEKADEVELSNLLSKLWSAAYDLKKKFKSAIPSDACR